jgi:hypothetical protein
MLDGPEFDRAREHLRTAMDAADPNGTRPDCCFPSCMCGGCHDCYCDDHCDCNVCFEMLFPSRGADTGSPEVIPRPARAAGRMGDRA